MAVSFTKHNLNPQARCTSLPGLLQAGETTCSKHRRAEQVPLNHASMEMQEYGAVPDVMGALHAGSRLLMLHAGLSCPGEDLTQLCVFICSGPAVLLAVLARHSVLFPSGLRLMKSLALTL